MNRKKIATSHNGAYSYWLDPDLYIYQRNEKTGHWQGWLCHLSVWESTFQYSAAFTLEKED